MNKYIFVVRQSDISAMEVGIYAVNRIMAMELFEEFGYDPKNVINVYLAEEE